jgi:Fic family protein
MKGKRQGMQRESGQYEISLVAGETVRAVVPSPLPPLPPLALDGPLLLRLERAQLALGRLDGVSGLLPDPDFFLYAYVRHEAVLSSQIEGTQSSLSDLLVFELEGVPGAPITDVVEVSRHVAALEHGLTHLDEGFPLSGHLLREVHGVLLAQGRGADKDPGGFRCSQNWIGGTRPGNAQFVPPPATRVLECMTDLEHFLNSGEDGLPLLVKAALAHAQFETIHPFLDGNGRVGRLLIALLLHEKRVLGRPLLYVSLFFKRHRAEYYRLLDLVRREGDWELWLDFFLEGVEVTAHGAVATAHQLLDLFQRDATRLGTATVSASLLKAHAALCQRPVLSIKELGRRAQLSHPTAAKLALALVDAGILRELTGRRRDRVFAYTAVLEILLTGVDPPDAKGE